METLVIHRELFCLQCYHLVCVLVAFLFLPWVNCQYQRCVIITLQLCTVAAFSTLPACAFVFSSEVSLAMELRLVCQSSEVVTVLLYFSLLDSPFLEEGSYAGESIKAPIVPQQPKKRTHLGSCQAVESSSWPQPISESTPTKCTRCQAQLLVYHMIVQIGGVLRYTYMSC